MRISFAATSAPPRCHGPGGAGEIDVAGCDRHHRGSQPPGCGGSKSRSTATEDHDPGLPACSGPLLQSTSTETALARCRPALVGRGQFGANVEFPNAEPVLANGTMLAFYGHSNGKKAILLHLYAMTLCGRPSSCR